MTAIASDAVGAQIQIRGGDQGGPPVCSHTHLFNKYFLSTYLAPGTVLDAINKISKQLMKSVKKLSSYKSLLSCKGDFPGGSVVKNPPANARDTVSIPGPGRSHMLQNN